MDNRILPFIPLSGGLWPKFNLSLNCESDVAICKKDSAIDGEIRGGGGGECEFCDSSRRNRGDSVAC